MMAGITAARRRRSGGFAPSGNLIFNPNGEGGIEGWINGYNSPNFTTRIGDIDAGLTNFYFGSGYSAAGGNRRQYQIVNIPAAYRDAACRLALSLDYKTEAIQDSARVILRFYSGEDATGDVLSVKWSDKMGPIETKAEFFQNYPVPIGAKSFTVTVFCFHRDGASAGVFFRNVAAVIHPSAVACYPIFAWNVPTELGWTVTTGNIVGSTSSSVTNTHSGDWNLPPAWGGSQANLAYNRLVNVPPAALAMVAAGKGVVELELINWRVNSSDTSRSYVAFLDANDSVLGIVQDAATPQPWSGSPTLQRHSATVPTGTTKFRVGHQFQRNDGSALDATVAQFSATLQTAP